MDLHLRAMLKAMCVATVQVSYLEFVVFRAELEPKLLMKLRQKKYRELVWGRWRWVGRQTVAQNPKQVRVC